MADETMVYVSDRERKRAAFLVIVILAVVMTAVFAAGAVLVKWFIPQ